MERILSPYRHSFLNTSNRVVMSAMTRGFSPDRLCNSSIEEYYARRAEDGVGLILTEGIIIHSTGNGYNDVPFLETDEQAVSWLPCTERVRAAGSKIFAQLWHCGRISHLDYTGGVAPVSSSPIQAEGVNRQNGKPFGVPRALGLAELPGIVDLYVQASKRALVAGFDGVELHFGHGYLIDQFLDSRINQRTDAYGGSIENRCRLAVETAEAVVAAVGSARVMVRISPSRDMGGLYDWPDLEPMLDHLLKALDLVGVRLLDISCANANYFQTSGRVARLARPNWKHVILGGASLSVESAEAELRDGYLDLVTWGRALIANPDLVTKLKDRVPWVPFDNAMRGSLV